MKFSIKAVGVFFRMAVIASCMTVLVLLPSCSLLDDEDFTDGSGTSVESSGGPASSGHESGKYTYATEPDSGFDRISKAYVYNAWYDVEKDNPVDYSSIDSNDAYALKCVFYFSEPVSGSFRAVLSKSGQQVAVKDIRIDGKVVAECDFSAGLEGIGTFEPGLYNVSLETEGKSVVVSGNMRVN